MATDNTSNAERMSLKKPKDKYAAQLGDPPIMTGIGIPNSQLSEEGNTINQQINDMKRSQSLAGYTTSDLKPPTSSIMGATDNASNMEGLSMKKKKDSSSHKLTGIIDNLWSQFDTENTGFLDKIEALNFINEVLVLNGKRKIQNNCFFNQQFDQYDADGEGQLSKKDIITLVETVLDESNSASSIWKSFQKLMFLLEQQLP